MHPGRKVSIQVLALLRTSNGTGRTLRSTSIHIALLHPGVGSDQGNLQLARTRLWPCFLMLVYI